MLGWYCPFRKYLFWLGCECLRGTGPLARRWRKFRIMPLICRRLILRRIYIWNKVSEVGSIAFSHSGSAHVVHIDLPNPVTWANPSMLTISKGDSPTASWGPAQPASTAEGTAWKCYCFENALGFLCLWGAIHPEEISSLFWNRMKLWLKIF
jgi:hypothetical protein